MNFKRLRWPSVAVAATCCIASGIPAAGAASTEPRGAEFAIRWNAQEGGPRTGDETLEMLGIRAKKASRFKVDYYDLPSTTKAPPGFSPILRRRIDDAGHSEMTFKLRGDNALADWSCPLRIAPESKAEVDFTFDGTGAATRMYSYSCKSAGTEAAASELAATRKPCSANVTRWERRELKVEEWRLPGDVLMIEVSGTGANTADASEQFRKRVAAPLLAAGIVPSANSKTELGSRCP